VVVIVIDSLLQRSGSKIRTPVMAFAVGVYLPFDLNVSIFLGGVIAWLVSRALDREGAAPARRSDVERSGLLAAAGFITGEALLGVALAVPVVLAKPIVLAGGKFEDFAPPALIFVVVVMILLYVLSLRKEQKPV
jgi:uncharacterized oligopeptide transporter (OPT) family protein